MIKSENVRTSHKLVQYEFVGSSHIDKDSKYLKGYEMFTIDKTVDELVGEALDLEHEIAEKSHVYKQVFVAAYDALLDAGVPENSDKFSTRDGLGLLSRHEGLILSFRAGCEKIAFHAIDGSVEVLLAKDPTHPLHKESPQYAVYTEFMSDMAITSFVNFITNRHPEDFLDVLNDSLNQRIREEANKKLAALKNQS